MVYGASTARLIFEQNMENQNYITALLVNQTPEEAFAAINDVRGWWSEEIEGDQRGAKFMYRVPDVHDTGGGAGPSARAELWPKLVAEAPQVSKYQIGITRPIPVFMLTRQD